MPLTEGTGKETIKSNIEELHAGPRHAATAAKHGEDVADKQSIAIALEKARESGAKIPRRSVRSRRAKTTR